MFKVDDLKDKVSELKLGDIIEMGATEDDYNAGDCEEFELRRPVRVRINVEMSNAVSRLLKKYDCSANILYKSATKLGAMILTNNSNINIIRDVLWFKDIVYDLAQNSGELPFIKLVNEYSNSIALESEIVSYKSKPMIDKSIYPYPKWRRVLEKISWETYLPKSVVYRIAISFALSTELKLETSEEFNKRLSIYCQKILNTTQNFCVVFKNSSWFIKFDYATYISNKLKKRKSLSEEVKKIIEEVLLNE